MERSEFERIAQEAFDGLPERFRAAVENVRIVVVEGDPADDRFPRGYRPGGILLGLYEGISLPRRGAGYGMYPVVPDTITLFKTGIESVGRTEGDIRRIIRDTLIHEIGHYFGLSEKEIRSAGY